jgi:hypothetical protein
MEPFHFQVLTDQARDRAKHHQESRFEQEKLRTRRRSRILGSVNDILAGSFKGVEPSKSELFKENKESDTGSAPGTPVQAGRRRYQRRGSCTMYNLETRSNHGPRKSPTPAPTETRRLSAPPLSYSSHSYLTSQESPQPRTIDERPIPRKNSSHHRRQFDENSVTSIDERPIPLKTSSHRRNSTGTSSHAPISRIHQGLVSSDDISIVSVESCHCEEPAMATIDQRPLPFKEVNINPKPMTHKLTSLQRPVRNSFQSAPTMRRPSALARRSPGALSRFLNSAKSKSTPNVVSPSQRRTREDLSDINPISPLPAPLLMLDNESPSSNLGSPAGSLSSRRSPPKKKLLRTSRSPENSRGGSRRKSPGALPTHLPLSGEPLPLSGELPLAGGGDDDDDHPLIEDSSSRTRRFRKQSSSTAPATPTSAKSTKSKKRLSLSLSRHSSAI